MAVTERRAFVLAALLVLAGPAVAEQDHAVILVYHHVSESTPASTSVSPAVFAAHLDYLAEHNYRVLPLEDIVAAFRDQAPLPAKAVAITFDDAYESIIKTALPMLARRDWPFTVFVSTDAIDQGFAGYMDWEDLRRLEQSGASIANHTRSHAHLLERLPGEIEKQWRARVTAEVTDAQGRLDDELEHPSMHFAYPYGEFDSGLQALVSELGYVAFGQQSGAAGAISGMTRLPRYPMATGFADLDGLAQKLRTRPLPVTVLEPRSNVLGLPAKAPTVVVRIPDGPYRKAHMRCYVAGQDPATIEWRADEATITAEKRIRPGRNKFNCTAPSSEETGVYYWYSHLWMQPRDDGSWYEE